MEHKPRLDLKEVTPFVTPRTRCGKLGTLTNGCTPTWLGLSGHTRPYHLNIVENTIYSTYNKSQSFDNEEFKL